MTRQRDRNETSSELGEHPVGTGVGAITGAIAAGAVAGTAAGPVGTIAGAIAGALVGGLAGRSIAGMADPAGEDAYWRDNYVHRPYVEPGSSYDDYGPAYRYGVHAYTQAEGRSFDEVQPELSRDWESRRGSSRLSWREARLASSDAWQRVSDAVERAIPGDSDHDGK